MVLLLQRLLTAVVRSTGGWIRVLADQNSLVLGVVECNTVVVAAAWTVWISVVVAEVVREERCQCGNGRRKWRILDTVAAPRIGLFCDRIGLDNLATLLNGRFVDARP